MSPAQLKKAPRTLRPATVGSGPHPPHQSSDGRKRVQAATSDAAEIDEAAERLKELVDEEARDSEAKAKDDIKIRVLRLNGTASFKCAGRRCPRMAGYGNGARGYLCEWCYKTWKNCFELGITKYPPPGRTDGCDVREYFSSLRAHAGHITHMRTLKVRMLEMMK